MRVPRITNTLVLAARVFKSLVLGSNLRSLRLLLRPRALVEYVSESLLLADSLGRTPDGVARKHVHEVFGSRGTERIVLGNLSPGAGHWLWASYAVDIVSLCMLCRLVRPGLVFEIGTLRGHSAYHFALNTADDAEIVTLDVGRGPGDTPLPALATTVLDDAHVARQRRVERYDFEGTPEAAKIRCVYGDSATFDFSPYHGRVDLFFIDGAHSEAYVASDTRNALACCRPGGVVVWHDFGRLGVEGVTKCVRELARRREIQLVPGGSIAFMRV